ncbi:MAG TPA: SUMF1/EgtB/PvdO family nonheme iron enzyme [Chthonomonadaceae bacterium]|nr:SUMF1/EgtB/PvdO family nonheme iron enzyme [Chthonomonadaceae bacterium]
MRSLITPLLAAAALAASIAAPAQSAKTLAAFAAGPHTGPVEQAIVGVTTRFTDGRGTLLEERHGCGMVLRSDGFILLSAAMLDHRSDEPDDRRPSIEVTLRPGTSAEQSLSAAWPRAVPAYISLRAVKVPDVHVPALRMLLPNGLKKGDALTAVWLPWNSAAHRFGPIMGRAVHCGARGANPKTPWIEPLDEELEGVPPGAIVLGPEGMAVGLITARAGEGRSRFVSWQSLGKVTNCVVPVPTTDAEFAAMAKPNAAAPPDPAAPNAADPPAAANNGAQEAGTGDQSIQNPGDRESGRSKIQDGMVDVPGGPILVPKALLDSQADMEKATVACVAPFAIDRYQVTNRQYWDYWSRLPGKTSAEEAFKRQAWPAGWGGAQQPFPEEIAGLPVLGVSLAGAKGYAKAQGKRLPTPYEWALAALGPGGETKMPEWIAQYISDTNDAAVRIKNAHIEFLKQTPDIHGDDFLLHSSRLHSLTVSRAKIGNRLVVVDADPRIHGNDFLPGLPWVISPLLGYAPELQGGLGFLDAINGDENLDLPLRYKMQLLSRKIIEQQTQPLWDKWKAPLAILAPGTRTFDQSPYGASDMIWNGPEIVAPPAAAPADPFGFAMSVTMTHPQDKRVLDDQLLVSGPNATSLVETYPGVVSYPISRLLERSPQFPVAQWLWFQNNLEETRAAMRTLIGWQVNMGPAAATAEIRVDNHSPFSGPAFYDNFPLYAAWSQPSKHLRTEIGSALPLPLRERLPTPIVPRESGAALRFLIPLGFRCAR